MEKFFESNLYILFALITYSILMAANPKKLNQKVLVLYIFMFLLKVSNILDLKIMILVFLLCTFIYFGFLTDDEFKNKIIKNIIFKFIDYFYIMIIYYKFLYFMISIFFISNFFFSIYYGPKIIPYLISFIILIYTVIKITEQNFELYKFTYIKSKLDEKVYFGNYKKLNNAKSFILTYIEDKSFFIRKNSYSFISCDFIKYKFLNISQLVSNAENKKLQIKYILNNLKEKIINILKNYKSYVRGYSTIDMQLFRTIAIKEGYRKVFKRKCAELIYSPIFFKGLREYYSSNYDKVTSDYFKNYLLVEYLHFAPIFIGNKRFTNIENLWNKKYYQLTLSEFFLGVLGLSNKLDNDVTFDKISSSFPYYIELFDLDIKELKQAIKKLNAILNK